MQKTEALSGPFISNLNAEEVEVSGIEKYHNQESW